MLRYALLILFLLVIKPVVYTQTNPDDYWLNNGFTSGQTVITNSGWFYDDGGDSLYNEGQNWNVNFCSENGNPITFDFSGFRTHTPGIGTWTGYDYMEVNYTGIGGYIVYYNDTPEFSFTSPDGCMTLSFVSNSDGLVDSGWVAEIFALPPPLNNDPSDAEELVVGNTCSPSFYTNKGAYSTTSLGSPPCKTFFGGDVWFRLVVPPSEVVKIETFEGTLTYAILDIYRSTDATITSDERIACIDDGGVMPSVTLTEEMVDSGDVLYVRLFGEQAKSGYFSICATDPTAAVTGFTGPGGVGDSLSLEFWYSVDYGLLNAADQPVIDGQKVRTWIDRSGNNKHLIQANSENQPAFNEDLINGFGALKFDGSDDVFTSSLDFGDAPLHWFIAGAFEGAQRQTLISVGDAAANKTASLSMDSDYRYFSFTGSDRYGPVLTDGEFYLFHAAQLLVSPFHFLELNGTSQTVDAVTTPLLSNGALNIGTSWDGSEPFNGYASEVIQYNKTLNLAQEIIVNNYISAKYNIDLGVNDLYAYKDSFYYDVAGIGRVNANNIHTKAESAGILAVSGADDLDNDEFLLFGHDNGDFSAWSSADVPLGDSNIVRLRRTWRVALAGGSPGEATVSMKKSVLPSLPEGFSAYNILVDSDGYFSSDSRTYGPYETGDELVTNNVVLNHGDHIAIAAVRPVLSFTSATSAEFESVSNPQIEVFLNYAVSTTVEVNYSVVEATAQQGVDYSLLTGSISIDPGHKTGNIIPLIIDDTIPEIPDEYFDIEITTSTPGIIAGGITRIRHTILNEDLDVDITASDTIIGSCATSISEIVAKASGTGPFTYSWTPADGLNATDRDTVIANPSATTTYTVEVMDTYGGSRSKDIRITVVPAPSTPTITVDGGSAICNGDSVKLSAQPGYSSYLWSTGETTESIRVKSTGDYNLIVTDTFGCDSPVSADVSVTVNPLPVNSLAVDDPSVCEGETATITLSGSESGVNYQLRLESDGSEVGAPVAGNGGDINFQVTPDVTTVYHLMATNGATGCSAVITDKSTVVVNLLPVNSLAVDDPAVCEGETATITLSGSESGVNYQLRLDSDDTEVGAPVAGNGGNITFQVTPGVTTVYHLLATNGATGCSAVITDKSTVVVNPLPVNSLAADDPAVCEGETATITLSNSESGVNYQLRLESDGSEVGAPVAGNGGDINFQVTPDVTTVYHLMATNGATGCSAVITDKSTVAVNPLPDKPVISIDGSLFLITGDSVELIGPDASAYLWTPEGETTQSIFVQSSGSYSLFVQNSFGCYSPESDPVEVSVSDFLPPPDVQVSGSLEFCDGGSVVLTGPDGYEQYTWSDGSVGQNITVTTQSDLTLVVTNNEGVQSLPSDLITVVVYEIPVIQILDKIEPSCAGFEDGSVSVSVAGGKEPYQFSWQGYQENTSTLGGVSAGSYTSEVLDDNGCSGTLEIELAEPDPITVEEIVEPAYCPDFSDGSIELLVFGGTLPYSFNWSVGTDQDYLDNLPPGRYSYQVQDVNSCLYVGAADVEYEQEACFIVPGIITPNNDGYNDTWQIDGLEVYPDVTVEIFDRWGKRIFYSKGYDYNFDGTFNGRELPMESYHYVIDLHNGSERIVGNLTIVR